MKQLLFALTLFSILNTSVCAQEYGEDQSPNPKKYNIGLRVGATFNTYTNNSASTITNSKTAASIGLHGGIIIKGNIKERIAIQAELLFNERGSANKASNGSQKQKLSRKIYYLEIPVLFKYYFGKSPIRFFAGTGPQIGYGLKMRDLTKTTFNGQSERHGNPIDWPEQINRLAILWLIDAGLNVAFDNGKQLEIGVRPQFGINNLDKTNLSTIKRKPMGVQLTAAYLF